MNKRERDDELDLKNCDEDDDFMPSVPKKKAEEHAKPYGFLNRYNVSEKRKAHKSRTCWEAWLKLKRGAVTNKKGCLLAKVESKDVYPKTRAENRWLPNHMLVFYAHHPEQEPKEGFDVSHLCHEPKCINPAHLRLEQAELNRDRNKCISWKWMKCPKHPEEEAWNPCQHQPQCVLENPF